MSDTYFKTRLCVKNSVERRRRSTSETMLVNEIESAKMKRSVGIM